MSPDKKLAWFARAGWTSDEIQEVRDLVVRRWNESYRPSTTQDQGIPASASITRTSSGSSWSQYRRSKEASTGPAAASSTFDLGTPDDLLKYLQEPPIPSSSLPRHNPRDKIGDTILYWHLNWNNHPELSRFASDYCSAPGRTFSTRSTMLLRFVTQHRLLTGNVLFRKAGRK
jgi:hypothetical protein